MAWSASIYSFCCRRILASAWAGVRMRDRIEKGGHLGDFAVGEHVVELRTDNVGKLRDEGGLVADEHGDEFLEFNQLAPILIEALDGLVGHRQRFHLDASESRFGSRLGFELRLGHLG